LIYKRIISGIPGTSVIFELEAGRFAIASLASGKIQVSDSLDSFYRFGFFDPAESLPKEDVDDAIEILSNH
jgi:hypothetical protein